LFCPGCRTWHTELIRDRGGNPRGCPGCGSLERHRLLALLLPALADAGSPTGSANGSANGRAEALVVDVAPSLALEPALDRLPDARRIRIDFDPAADGRQVDVRASVSQIPLPDASVDLLICSHVLEHVPDDAAAMRELGRVLSVTGLGVVIVPQRVGVPTDEDPGASAEDRIARFGQADHVRYYGDDVDDRLAAAGLVVSSFRCDEVVPPSLLNLLHLLRHERFWLVRRQGSDRPLPTADELRGRLLGALDDVAEYRFVPDAEHRRLQAETARWQRSAERWERRFRELHDHPAVRVMLAVRRAARGRSRQAGGGRPTEPDHTSDHATDHTSDQMVR
jgi:SAM-dependent methyltransferase